MASLVRIFAAAVNSSVSSRSDTSRLACIALFTPLFLGCANAILTTARPIGDGIDEVAIAPQVRATPRDPFHDEGASGETASVGAWPSLDVGYRHGVGDQLDFGVTINGWGNGRLDAKVGGAPTDWFAAAVDAGVSSNILGLPEAGYVRGDAALLFDLAPSDAVRVTLGPVGSVGRVHRLRWYTAGGMLGTEIVANPVFAVQPFVSAELMFDTSSGRLLVFGGGVAFKLRPGRRGL